MIDWPTLVNGIGHYVPELVIVIIFMIYEERQQTRHDRNEAERTRARIVADEKRDTTWQQFLKEERDQRKEDNGRSEHSLEVIETKVGSTYDLLKIHDEWERRAQANRRRIDPDTASGG